MSSFFSMSSASRARGASRVLALQGLGSCSHLSPNLVCASRRQPPPAAIKADGVSRHRTNNSERQRYRSPEPRGRYARTSEPPWGAGRRSRPGGEEGEPRSTAVGERTREPDGSERSEERATTTFKRPTGTSAPLKGARETGVFDRLDASLLKQKD